MAEILDGGQNIAKQIDIEGPFVQNGGQKFGQFDIFPYRAS